MSGEFGVVANALGDKVLRPGAKVWITGGAGGEGYERYVVFGKSRGGRNVAIWRPSKRLTNFRAAWIPPPMQFDLNRDKRYGAVVTFLSGTRAEMEVYAAAVTAYLEAA